MQITTYYMINMGISGLACMISVLSLMILIVCRWIAPETNRYLLGISGLSILYNLSYLFGSYFLSIGESPLPSALYIGISIAIFFQFSFGYDLIYSILRYIIHCIEKNEREIPYRTAVTKMFILTKIFLIGNLFYPFLYRITIEGKYYCLGGYFLVNLLDIIFLAIGVLLVVLYREDIDRETFISCVLFGIAFILSAIVYVIAPDIEIYSYSNAVVIFVMSIYIPAGQVGRYISNEEEMEEIRTQLMMTQMRPHFLYNALSSISQLCKSDGELASVMTDHFHEYLQKNMTDIVNSKPVPFHEELKYIESYIAIEQMRFGEDLAVSYHIEAVDFYVPPMVIQPLLENSIKHGIGGREEGGVLTISTRKYVAGNIITIADDGVGFNPEQMIKPNDGRVHVGMNSVQKRIDAIRGAKLIINSSIGNGTTIMIVIPNSYGMS